MPVHLFGRPAPLAQLAALGVPILEDAAQAFGAPGIATTGVCSTFSFFPTKNLFALGDGGLIAFTDECGRARRCVGCASTAPSTRRPSSSSGRTRASTRFTPPRCASSCRASRAGTAPDATRPSRYAELGLGEVVELPGDEAGHVYHMFVVRSSERDRIAAALAEVGIASASYYVTPLHLQPAMAYLGYEPGSLPETERAAAENLALPMWGGIGSADQERVVATVRAAVGVAV